MGSTSGTFRHFRGPWNFFWILGVHGAKKVKNPWSRFLEFYWLPSINDVITKFGLMSIAFFNRLRIQQERKKKDWWLFFGFKSLTRHTPDYGSISPTFYAQLFCTKVFSAAFLYLQFGFVFVWRKNIGAKAARKMLVKLTPAVNGPVERPLQPCLEVEVNGTSTEPKQN